MTEEILALCSAMGADMQQETLLRPLIHAAVTDLEGRLKAGVTPEECGGAFELAAAMTAMEMLEQAAGGGQVTSFTAGQVSIRTDGSAERSRTAQAQRLLAPWLGETGFAFRGVRG